MNRAALILTTLCILLTGCEPSPALPTRPVPFSSQLPATPASQQGAAFNELPLVAGFGIDGGWYQLYFTNPSDPMSEQRSGGLDEALVTAIDSARDAVDAAMYSLSLRSVRQALVRARRRGVRVRVVMESDNLDASGPQALKDAGIPVIGDRREGLMHNKFIVIDRMEVWTGSMNFTNDGAYADRNNLICIRSPKLAADYEAEFNEMFVDDRFGPDMGSVTPYPALTLGGAPVKVYFSPDDHVQDALLSLLDGARISIDFLAYSFTSDPLSAAIQRRAKAGVKVLGVMDAGQIATNTGTEYDSFRSLHLDVRMDGEAGLMHEKVLIVDGHTVVMGSYNFTASAEQHNDENVLIIEDSELAEQFQREFERIYASAQP